MLEGEFGEGDTIRVDAADTPFGAQGGELVLAMAAAERGAAAA